MKIGTVKWFNPHKGYGYIHPDDGSPNVFVHKSVVESAGMDDLKGGQRIIFESQRDHSGSTSAVSLKALELGATTHLEDPFAITNPFDIISAFISSTIAYSRAHRGA